MEKRTIDWERIEDQYQQGLLSLREICAAHDDVVTEGAIRKRAKRDGWERDLTAKIQAKADALVRRAEYADGTQRPDERTLVESGALAVVGVKLSQKSNVGRLDKIVAGQLEELEALKDEDLKVRIGLTRTLTDSLKSLLLMQADIWGFANIPDAAPPPERVDPVEGARRLAFVLRRAQHEIQAQHTIQ